VKKVTFLILSTSQAARVAEGSQVNRMPHLRLVDDTQECLEISRLEKNIRPRIAAIQDVIKSPIDDRSCDAWSASQYTVNILNRINVPKRSLFPFASLDGPFPP